SEALAARASDNGEEWGVRQAALLALARVDPARYATVSTAWSSSPDVFERITAVNGWGSIPGGDAARYSSALRDSDPRVRAVALEASRAGGHGRGEALIQSAQQAWQSGDPRRRARGLQRLADTARAAGIDLRTSPWQSGDPVLRETALSRLIRLPGAGRAFLP